MVFRVKSDNCAEQFKSRYVFGFCEHFSQTNNIPVLLFYGVVGHGKGLVDSMSSFGVKMPIREAIVREDFWYKDSKEIERFLSLKFFEDPKKNYYVLQPDELIKRNEEKGKYERQLKGVKQMVMVSFFPNGKIVAAKNYCACENCIVGNFDHCYEDVCDRAIYDGKKSVFKKGNHDIMTDDVDNDDDGTEDVRSLDDDVPGIEIDEIATIREMVKPGDFIALNSFTHIEQFYLCKVHEVCVASDDVEDSNGHCFQKGEAYILSSYLTLVKKKKGTFFHKELKGTVFVDPKHIIFPGVEVSKDLTISINEYQDICANIR